MGGQGSGEDVFEEVGSLERGVLLGLKRTHFLCAVAGMAPRQRVKGGPAELRYTKST